MQKLSRPGKFVKAPRKKASASVTDVIVMEGPACFKPILNLSSADRWSGAQSIQLTMTNMSSTPIPSSMNGKMLCATEALQPIDEAIAYPEITDKMTQDSPIIADRDLRQIGLQLPKTMFAYTNIKTIADATSPKSPKSCVKKVFSKIHSEKAITLRYLLCFSFHIAISFCKWTW